MSAAAATSFPAKSQTGTTRINLGYRRLTTAIVVNCRIEESTSSKDLPILYHHYRRHPNMSLATNPPQRHWTTEQKPSSVAASYQCNSSRRNYSTPPRYSYPELSVEEDFRASDKFFGFCSESLRDAGLASDNAPEKTVRAASQLCCRF